MSKKQSRAKKFILITVSILLALILILLLTFVILSSIGKKKLLNNSSANILIPSDYAEIEDGDGKTVLYNGQKYVFNENITSVLLIGVDKEQIKESEYYGENGQADLLVLMALDTSTGKLKAIPISRDTMVDINLYSKSGQYLGVSNEQICLSYAYGDGKEKSCENTIKSVSRLLYGMPINSYLAFDINSIKVLNDTIGGVTLTVDKDIQLYDKFISKGQSVTLKGEYALRYIRGRDKTSIEANNERMSRQKNYMSAFFKTTMQMTKKDITTPIKLYNKISKSSVSNLTVADISYLTQCVLLNSSNTSLNYASIKGSTVKGEKYAEFHHNKEALHKLVIDTFYLPVEEKEN